MKFRIVAVLGVLASLVAAQGVLTYPDVFYYKFNEGSGQQVVNHAIPGGALYQPTFENANPLQWDNTTPALGGSAWKPAGLNRLLSNGPTKINQSYTIECWFKTPAAYVSGNLQRLFGDYSVSTFRAYIGFYGPGAYYLGGNVGTPALCAGCTTAQASAGVSANVYDGNWHHLALVFDQAAGTLTSYVDGNVDLSKTGVIAGTVAGTNFQLGGVVGAGTPVTGTIDEFRWWGEARSQAQIQASMSTELIPQVTNAAFYATTRTGNAPLLTTFKNTSSTPVAGGLTYAWDFENDGIVDSTLAEPCHVYANPGIYTVSLTVTDTASGTSTATSANYINVGAAGFTLATCGQGSIFIGAPPPPTGWAEGFTLVSFETSAPKGTGLFFGINPDSFTIFGITVPAGPGNPFHFVNVGIPSLYPEAPFTAPAGAVSGLVGLTMDAVVVYRDAIGGIINWTNVARVTF